VNWIVRSAAVVAITALIGMPTVSALAQDATPVADHREVEIAYVLHGYNTFTEEMVAGAEDAARDYGVTLEVYGDASFDVPAEIAAFESALQSGSDGVAVAPLDGDLWIAPIQVAVDGGVPVVGFNVTALDSALTTWVGQDDYDSGVSLGGELLKQLNDAGVAEGTIAVGSCNPEENVLQDREAGLRQAFAGTPFALLDTQDVHLPVPENLSAWEGITAANPDIVAAVGLCYIDVPNLAQIKERTGRTWLIGGYNLDAPTLAAITRGQAQVVIGQQEYLQGYLPVAILAEHLVNGAPLVTGWLETPAEVVTAANVAQYAAREADDQVQYDDYQAYIAEHFADLQAAARPYDDLRTLGASQATLAP
jgi:ABC-type sugar transport system substrate-binding protein